MFVMLYKEWNIVLGFFSQRLLLFFGWVQLYIYIVIKVSRVVETRWNWYLQDINIYFFLWKKSNNLILDELSSKGRSNYKTWSDCLFCSATADREHMISLRILFNAIIGKARIAIENKIYSEMHAQRKHTPTAATPWPPGRTTDLEPVRWNETRVRDTANNEGMRVEYDGSTDYLSNQK
jgi:hypothetical protein